MIIRVFRARIHPGKEDEFERFVRETGVPMVQAQAGCSHVAWGRSRWSDQPQFAEEEHMLAEVFCDHYETVATH